MLIPRRRFLHLTAGAAMLPAASRLACAQSYPARPVALSSSAMAPAPLRTSTRDCSPNGLSERLGQSFRDREPARRRDQSRGRSRGARAAGRLYAAPRGFAELHQCDALRQSQFQFHPRHRTGCEHRPRALRHGGYAIVPGQDRSRVHRLCQGQSWQDQHGVGRHRNLDPFCRRAVQDAGRRRHGSRPLSHRRAGAHRYDQPAVPT